MVETIAPVVHGDRRSYRLTVALHVLGSGLAAAIVGTLAGAAGGIAGAPWGRAGIAFVGAGALLYLLREVAGLPVPVPSRRGQVPEWWRTFFSLRVTALLYGVGLGAGFATFLYAGTFVVVVAGALVTGSPAAGALLCLPFGVARGAAVLVARRTHDGAGVTDVAERVGELGDGGFPRWANSIALAAIVGATIIALT